MGEGKECSEDRFILLQRFDTSQSITIREFVDPKEVYDVGRVSHLSETTTTSLPPGVHEECWDTKILPK